MLISWVWNAAAWAIAALTFWWNPIFPLKFHSLESIAWRTVYCSNSANDKSVRLSRDLLRTNQKRETAKNYSGTTTLHQWWCYGRENGEKEEKKYRQKSFDEFFAGKVRACRYLKSVTKMLFVRFCLFKWDCYEDIQRFF